MIGISHWGLTPAWDSMELGPLQYAWEHGFVTFHRDDIPGGTCSNPKNHWADRAQLNG